MNLVYRTIHGVAKTFFRGYGRWKIIGHENIPKTGPVIVCPNHVSFLDPPLVGAAIRRECAFMARHDLWNGKVMTWLLPRLGAFPIHRDKPDRQAIRLALEALEKGLVLIMFPEGTRSDDGNLQAGEPGVALIVQKSGAPVVPAAVIGPERMLPPGQSKLKRTPLTVAFGGPIFFTPDSPREEIVGTIMRAIAELMSEHGRPMEAKERPSVGVAE